jgi:hypothetical protein
LGGQPREIVSLILGQSVHVMGVGVVAVFSAPSR